MKNEIQYQIERDGEPLAIVTVEFLVPGVMRIECGFNRWPNDRKRPKLSFGACCRWRLGRDEVEMN